MSRYDRIAFSSVVLKWVTVLLIVKVLFSILSNYPDYFPPNFESDFLLGRKAYFAGAYGFAFYTHILTTPFALVSGLLLMSRSFRRKYPAKHRLIGKMHVIGILLLVVPSSLWMSAYAFTGHLAGAGFALLSLSTGYCVAMGWRRARERNFIKHRYWMTRCFVMLCSAVVLRLISGAATIMDADSVWTYPLAAWVAWIVPLFGLEFYDYCDRRAKGRWQRPPRG